MEGIRIFPTNVKYSEQIFFHRKGCVMAMQTKLPMGIENFREIRTGGFYYVDKTGLIKTLLENPGKVNLFTRLRQFGKTL